MLTNALKVHETTANFHKALIKCLEESLKNGKLPYNIVDICRHYLGPNGKRTSSLPKFDKSGYDLINGTVLTIHDIWSMRVYIENLEYKSNQIRGTFNYEIQDHFGLDTNDINHDLNDGIKQFEQNEGFRSWYILQHFEGYGFEPFITEIDFKL